MPPQPKVQALAADEKAVLSLVLVHNTKAVYSKKGLAHPDAALYVPFLSSIAFPNYRIIISGYGTTS